MVIFVLFFEKILRRFFIGLDSVLFNFISTLYDLLIEISKTSILSQGEIARLAQRIELLLGIFMLFKLSFSLITYIVNPDDFSDKQKGFGKLIQSAVISLLMLVLVPYIFQMAFNLQTKILEGNVLAKLIMGEDTGGESYLNSAGDEMAFDVMLPFFLPNTGLKSYDLSSCISLYDSNGAFSQDCQNALTTTGINDVTLSNYVTGINERSLGLTFRSAMAIETPKDEDEFIIDYKLLISTVVAVVVCLLLVTFCIDIGVRSVKLAFLQLIYPIPVISYMDPKSGKDGLFKKWYKMCFSTFLSLFVRLLALYFGIYIIYRVGQFGMYDVVTGAQKTGFWLQVFIIIGVLMFVKQLPKILENMGIKLDGDGKFTLNPLKKIEEGAIGGKYLSRVPKAAAGAAIGLGMGAVGTATGAGAGKWFTGMTSGLANGLKGKKIGEIHKGQVDANQRLREARANGSTFFGRRGSDLRNLVGASEKTYSIDKQITENEKAMKPLEDEVEAMKNISSTKGKMKDRAKSQLYDSKFDIKKTAGAEYAKMQRKLLNAKHTKEAMEEKAKKALEAGIISSREYGQRMARADSVFNGIEDKILEDYADYSLKNSKVDGVDLAITGMQSKDNATIKSSKMYSDAGIKEIKSFKDVKDNDGSAQGRITDIEVTGGLNEMRQKQKELKNSDEYNRAQADKKARNR